MRAHAAARERIAASMQPKGVEIWTLKAWPGNVRSYDGAAICLPESSWTCMAAFQAPDSTPGGPDFMGGAAPGCAPVWYLQT